MKNTFYKLLIALTKRMGLWVFRVMAWFVAIGYFLFFPGRVAVSVRFYGLLLPSRGRLYHLWCTWKQYHNFTYLYLDRFLLFGNHNLSFSHEGLEYLIDAVSRKEGGIILMSHVGNWEIAAHMLLTIHDRNSIRMKLLLYLGQKHKEQIERVQKESLIQSGVKLIVVDENGGSPVDIVEGINFLKGGGLVSLTGDRIWHSDQRTVPVIFLGREVLLPEIPFVFALLSGAPLFIFFGCRVGKKAYHFQVLPPEYVRAKDRKDRQEAIRKAAQAYADRLEEKVRQYPFQWYHFEPLIERKPDEKNSGYHI